MKKYLKYLYWPGLVCGIAGIVIWLITGKLSLLPIGLILTGVVFIIAWFVIVGNGAKEFWSRRSAQAGTNALVSTLAMLAIMALINFLAVRYTLRLDLTENQLFTLSPETQAMVSNLPEPLQVWMFQREPNKGDRQLLANYSGYSDNFQYQFVDPDIDIGKAQKFGITTEEAVYLEYGGKRQLLQVLNRGESLSEIKLTNAIEQIQRSQSLYLYVLQGHGEVPLLAQEGSLSEAVQALEGKGYTVAALNLAQQGEIPENANAAIVPAPQRPLFPEEVEALQQYVEGGGGLLLMIDPETNSGLEPLLSQWGIKLDERIAIDRSAINSLPPRSPLAPLVNTYGNHPITENFGRDYSLYPFSRPLQLEAVAGIEAAELIISNDVTWGEKNIESQELQFNPEEDLPGPLYFGFALTNNTSREENEAEGRMVVFGGSAFATNGLFNQPQLLNGDMLLNAINWLVKSDRPILSIRPKEQENRRINLTPFLGGVLWWSALRIVPLLGLIAAFIAWSKRR